MKKLFKEHFVSYISIMLIPVVILTLYLNTFERMLVKKIALNTYEEKLANASQRIESVILNKNVLASQWFCNNAFSYGSIQNDYSVLQSVFSYLKQSEIEDDSVAQILYLFAEEGFVIASNHTTDYENVGIYSFRDLDGAWAEYSDTVLETEEAAFFPGFRAEISGREKTLIPYVKPGREDGGVGEKVIFLFDAEKLLGDIGTVFGENFENIFMFSGDKLIAAAKEYDKNTAVSFSNLKKSGKTAVFKQKIALFGLNLAITVPTKIVYKDIRRMRMMCAAVFVLCIVMGALMAAQTAKKRLKPFEAVWTKVSDAYPAEDYVPEKWNDAMAHLHGAAEHFSEMNLSYKKMREYMRGLLYRSMLTRDFKIMDGIEVDGFELSGGDDGMYAAMIIGAESAEKCENIEKELGVAGISVFFFKEDDSTIGILNLRSGDDAAETGEAVKRAESEGAGIRIGKFYRGIENLSKSYFEIKGVSDETANVQYPYDKISEFSVLIKKSDFAGANAIVREIVEQYEKELPFFLLKCLIVNLLLSYLKIMEEKKFFKTFSMERYLKDISVIQNAQTTEEFRELLYMSCDEWNECLSKKEDEDRSVIDGIMKYIGDNYADCDFSLKENAEIFGDKSKTYISGMFKEVTGQTMTEYLWKKRFEKAVELIETTELSINEISNRVGYAIPNSFIRKFKAETGVTPNEYRRKSAGGSE